MQRESGSLALTIACCSGVAGAVETTQFDITGLSLSIFGVMLTTDYLGPATGTIVETRAELTFVNDGPLDAADLLISFQAPSEGVPFWELSGADLGWSGTGTFRASLSTDELNGEIDLGDPPPDFSLFLLVIQAQGFQPLSGQFTGSFFQVDLETDAPCPADIDVDGQVGAADLAQLLGAWGPNPGHAADLNGDGEVNAADLAALLGAWGPC